MVNLSAAIHPALLHASQIRDVELKVLEDNLLTLRQHYHRLGQKLKSAVHNPAVEPAKFDELCRQHKEAEKLITHIVQHIERRKRQLPATRGSKRR